MTVPLRFRSASPSGPPWRLVFGADDAQAPVTITIDLGAPVLALSALLDPVTVTGYCSAGWKGAESLDAARGVPWSEREQASGRCAAPWVAAAKAPLPIQAPWRRLEPRQRPTAEPWRGAARVGHLMALAWRRGIWQERHAGGSWRQGVFVDGWTSLPWAGGIALGRTITTLAADARLFPAVVLARWSDGSRRHRHNREPWRDGARLVSYGSPWPPELIPEPPGHVCYAPSTLLRFLEAARTDANLRFVCRHGPGPTPAVIVPIRSVYMVTNSVSLVRVIDGVPIPADSLRLSLDDLSWAWGFSANVPANVLGLVEPTEDGPVELLATINGTAFRLLAEQVGRERTFGNVSIRVQGRGRVAELDAPYALVQSFGNASPRTAQQLMGDVLTVGGVPLDWTVDWELDDWLVPAGVWSHQGTYISALNAIVKAAGGYLLPHTSAKSFKALHRYPAAPWDWAGVTPDLALPAAVTRRESLDWIAKPAYNRVFIAPQGSGLNGHQVTRDGTAGDVVAPLVVDALMTEAAAARQRARAELGQGGRQITVGLGLPVLPETGIVLPGTFIQYADGSDIKRGLVRSVSVDASFPNVWQTIGVETHV